MADAFDRVDEPVLSEETLLRPAPITREPLPLENPPSSALPPLCPVRPESADGLVKAAEFIGGTAGKIVGTSRSVYRKLDMRHKKDMRALRKAAGEIEEDVATLSDTATEIFGSVKRYFDSHDARDMAQDAIDVAKRYPKRSLAVAVVLGFLVERALVRRSG